LLLDEPDLKLILNQREPLPKSSQGKRNNNDLPSDHTQLTFADSYFATLMFGVAVQAKKEGTGNDST
jgi:hypothetical protein